MEWSDDKPSEEGYYWYRDEYTCQIVHVYYTARDDQLRANGAVLYEHHPVANLDGQWAGPIPRPLPPESPQD